jgi:exopolyphosphatase/guanosine-5'-triphosphate,3'-diphosphate pyrophosphatase
MKAAIDIGSNSIRLLIGQAQDGRIQAKRQELITTRLGNTKSGQELNPKAVQDTLQALKKFKTILTDEGIDHPPIVAATSAVREAKNQQEFKALIQKQLGWELQILSGEQEAFISYTGATIVCKPGSAVLDVGGGSTELIFPSGQGLKSKSVPVGAVRLYRQELGEAAYHQLLNSLLELAPQAHMSYAAVGGTITSIAAIQAGVSVYQREKINGTVLTVAKLQEYYDMMKDQKPEALIRRYPLLKDRADIICFGLRIYLDLARILAFQELTVSDCGLLDGLLLAD